VSTELGGLRDYVPEPGLSEVTPVYVLDFRRLPYSKYKRDVKYAMEQVLEFEDDPELVAVARKVLAGMQRGPVELTTDEYAIFNMLAQATITGSKLLKEAIGPSATRYGFDIAGFAERAEHTARTEEDVPYWGTPKEQEEDARRRAQEAWEKGEWKADTGTDAPDRGYTEPGRSTEEWGEWEQKRRGASRGHPEGLTYYTQAEWEEWEGPMSDEEWEAIQSSRKARKEGD